MEDYYNTLLKHLDGYTVMGLFDGKRDIEDIVTLQTGSKGRVFLFDQEPMIKSVDDDLWDYIFQEPTIFANSELDSTDKDYVKNRYPNFIDWYYFANALVSREWLSAQRCNYAGWSDHKQTVLDCNLLSGSRQYRIYLAYHMFKQNHSINSYISFNGEYDWKKDLEEYDYFNILEKPHLDKLPKEKISYDNWGKENKKYNGFMQSRIPLEFYSQVNYIIVAETLFIENKKHLTEKVFKPVAAGKPFVLAAGVNNLNYLKNYGFETFNSCWNEDYNKITNPKQRLEKIFDLIDNDLQIYLNYTVDFEKIKMFEQAHIIAQKNRQYFWSEEFYNLLINEAVENLEVAKIELASKRI